MRFGDRVLFYHSVTEKMIVGLAEVSKTAFPDPTDEQWIAVEIALLEKFAEAVTLAAIKAANDLKNIALLKQTRLSVVPLTKTEFETILSLAKN